MPQNGNKIEQDIQEYSREWYNMMTRIWRDRLNMMVRRDTGTLFHSVQNASLQVSGMSVQAVFRFVEYGLYVDAGTGNGYRRGNGGNLEFLNKSYRKIHGMGKPREKRPWFSRSWAISRRVIGDKMQDLIGEKFIGLFDTLADS